MRGSRRELVVWAAVAGISVLALAVRLHSLTAAPHDFHPTRQLFDALMARGFWLDLGGTPPPGTRAAVEAASPTPIEPPVTQLAAGLLYRLLGHEDLWLVRALLALVWVLGGIAVWWCAARITDRVGGVAALLVWSFVPFGVLASRSFQPDGLMLVLIAAAVAAGVRHHLERSRRWLVVTALLAATAVFVKLTAVFFVVPVFLALAWQRSRRQSLRQPAIWVLPVVVLAPSLLFLVLAALVGGAAGQEGGRILPHLLLEGRFWQGWWEKSAEVVGVTGLATIALGVVLARGTARVTLLGLTAGYVGFGLTFPYHYSTHNYYHLPLVLMLGLVWAVLAATLFTRLREKRVLLVAALVVAGSVTATDLARTKDAPDVFAAPSTRWTELVTASRQAGRALDHSTRVVWLAPYYGRTLEVYGHLAGRWWPPQVELRKEEIAGTPPTPPDERLREISTDMAPEWFVVLGRAELRRQPDLRKFLDETYDVERRGNGWIAYRLGE